MAGAHVHAVEARADVAQGVRAGACVASAEGAAAEAEAAAAVEEEVAVAVAAAVVVPKRTLTWQTGTFVVGEHG